jgi:anthranilate synthase component II
MLALMGLLFVLVSFTTSFRLSKVLPKASSTSLGWTSFHAEGRDTRKNIEQAKVSSSVVHTLLIDNYDSYTYNLYQLLSEVNGVEPHVIFNDDFKDWESLLENCPHFDNIVLSPGPGSPSCPKDVGICKEAVLKAQVPVLGVCLGHQGIAEVFGTPVHRASRPVHGERFTVNHTGTGIFQGLPQGFQVVRYHSLAAAPAVENPLRITAWTTDGVVMGLEHISKPIYGVQFHPESILSESGSDLISSFKSITLKHSSESSIRTNYMPSVHTPPIIKPKNIDENENENVFEKLLYLHTTKVSIPSGFTFEDIFRCLYEKSNASFWLDTSREPVNMEINERVVSFAGAIDIHGSGEVIEYWGDKLIFRNVDGEVTKSSSKSIFDFIDSFTKTESPSVICDETCSTDSLPFIPHRKIFGHISYEARHVATARMHGRSESTISDSFSSSSSSSSLPIPLSVFLQPTQYLVYDHSTTSVYIVSEGKSATNIPLVNIK